MNLAAMSERLNILPGVILILSMVLFNIGIPVVLYLCPMPDANAVCCSVPPKPTDGSHSVGRQSHSCCNVYVGAERNTTPYRIAQLSSEHDFKIVGLLASDPSLSSDELKSTVTQRDAASSNITKPPLFVLDSSFLI